MSFRTSDEIIRMRKVLLLSALFFCGLIFLISCKKTGELTPSFSEGDLNAIYTDTTTIFSITQYDDSVRTDETSRNLFGVINDPLFGVTQASFYTQFRLTTTALEFPPGVSIDSVVLRVAYDEVYGTPQSTKVNVFEITESMAEDDDYYNYSTVSTSSTALGTKEFLPNLSDTIVDDTITVTPQLKVLLDQSFGERILAHGSFEDNEDFLAFFNGLHLAPDLTTTPGVDEGNILSFNLLSSSSGIFIYYKFPGENNVLQFGQYQLSVISGTPRFSNYKHFYEGTVVESSINVSDLPSNYVQPMAGVKTKISFPYIRNIINDGNVVINKAELLITVSEGTNDVLLSPEKLVLLTKDENGDDVIIPDFFEGSDYYGGGFDINTNTYQFNIARYIDGLVNKNITDRGLFLVVSGTAVKPNRLVLNSGANSTSKLKLRLTFTQL